MEKLAKDIGEVILTAELGGDSLPIGDDLVAAIVISTMREKISSMPEQQLEQLYEQVLKYVCERRSPALEKKYYEFSDISSDVAFCYSKGVSWEGGKEVRLARSVNEERILLLRSRLNIPIFIISTKDELDLWVKVWKGRAFLTSDMAEHFIPDFL